MAKTSRRIEGSQFAPYMPIEEITQSHAVILLAALILKHFYFVNADLHALPY